MKNWIDEISLGVTFLLGFSFIIFPPTPDIGAINFINGIAFFLGVKFLLRRALA